MKKTYLKPSVEYINFYSNEDIASDEFGGDFGEVTPSNPGGSIGGDHGWDD